MNLLPVLLLGCCAWLSSTVAPRDRLLDAVPADTPFLYAVTEPMPIELANRWFDYRDAMAMNQLEVRRILDADAAATRNSASGLLAPPIRRLLQAVHAEMDYSSEDEFVRRTGLVPGGRLVLYAFGLAPVIRLELIDVDATRGLLKRLKKAWGGPERTLKAAGKPDRNSWVLPLGDFQLVALIDAPYLVVTLVPQELDPREVVLAAPRQRYDAEQHVRFNRAHGYGGSGSGFVDLPATLRLLYAQGDSPIRTLIEQWGEAPLPKLNAACRAELAAAIAHTPRLSVGAGTVDNSLMEFKLLLAADAALGKDLDRIAAPGPALPRSGTQMGLAMALNVPALVEVLKARADAVAAAPFQCADFQHWNAAMSRLRLQLDQIPTAMFEGHSGYAALFHRIDLAATDPTDVRFSLLARSRNPAALFGFLQLTTPALATLEVQPDGQPVRLEMPDLGPPWQGGALVMTEELLGFSNAEDAADRLRNLATARQPGRSPLLQYSAAGALLGAMADNIGEFAQGAGEDPAEIAAVQNFYRQLAETVRAMDLRVIAGPRGLEFHFLMSHVGTHRGD